MKKPIFKPAMTPDELDFILWEEKIVDGVIIQIPRKINKNPNHKIRLPNIFEKNEKN
jgi:hypothetical protein